MSKKITDENGKTYVEKKPIWKKWWFWLIIVLIVGGCAGSMGSEEEQSTSDSSTEQTKSSKETTSSSTKKVTINPVVKQGEELNKEGVTKTLQAGKWTVGKDIKPGHYKITTPSGAGNVMGDTKYGLNIMLSATTGSHNMYLTEYNTYLFKDDKIDIQSLQNVKFEAIKQSKEVDGGTLEAGDYIVGLDIKPGRYKIQAVEGNGNLSTNDAVVNEMFGTDTSDDLYVNKTTQDLKKGQVLSTTLNKISLTKE